MSIRPLPQDVADKIKSSVLITSVNGVIGGLFKNALDAEATRINVSLDFVKGNCVVEDDGVGIAPAEFRSDGGLGKLHHTSKLHPQTECHGYHGDFLASLGALSLLSVSSHHREHNSHNSLAIHQSTVISRRTPAPPEQKFLTFSHGARVSVRDLFGPMPVRVKQRPTAGDRAALEREWNRLLHDVVALVLAWPTPVSVFIREATSGREVRLRPQTEQQDAGFQGLVPRVSSILIQANLAEPVDVGSWETVSGSSGKISLRGCISLNPIATRRSQFICVGVQPIPNQSGSNELYDEVNRVFSNSSFPKTEDSDLDSDGSNEPARERKQRRAIDRWPMFHFRIDLGRQEKAQDQSIDRLLYERYRLQPIVDLLKKVSYAFLEKHQYQPRTTFGLTGRDRLGSENRKSRKPAHETEPGPSSRAASRVLSPFDQWSRIKVGKPINTITEDKADLPAHCPVLPAQRSSTQRKPEEATLGDPDRGTPPLLDSSGRLLRCPFGDVPSFDLKTTGVTKSVVSSSRPRSSVTIAPSEIQPPREEDVPTPSSQRPGTTQSSTPLVATAGRSNRVSLTSNQPTKSSEWASNLLKSWENPVFETVEQPIRKIPTEFDTTVKHGGKGWGFFAPGSRSMSLQGRLSRHALRNAQVISQVDKKFILVRLPMTSTAKQSSQGSGKEVSSLVMVDQHAADERCRLEELMRDYFAEGKAATELLPHPIRYEVTPREGALFRRCSSHFEYWGILYGVEGAGGTRTTQVHAKVCVVSLPPGILERCRQEPRILIDLLRAEIWKLDEEGKLSSSISRPRPSGTDAAAAASAASAPDWVSAFQGCPRGMLDLLNSRACRSAIMFNDTLSKTECGELIGRLSRCAFPFQCAHGRPSMVPLLDLGEFCGRWEQELELEPEQAGDNTRNKSTQLWKSWVKNRNK